MIHNAGSLNIDDVFRTSHIVRPGETINSSSLERFAGGKGLNQSLALARAGASVRHIGRIGSDGLFLREGLAADAVDVSGIDVGDLPTGHAVIQVADDGENAIVLYSGANHAWGDADVTRLLNEANPGDVLLLQNEITMIPELMEAAVDAGLKLAFNPAPMMPEVKDYPLKDLSWLIVNEIEGRELAGTRSLRPDSDDIPEEEVLKLLRDISPKAVIVMTLGKRGALYLDEQEVIGESFPAQGTIVDTTGAGDTFIGYFLAGEIDGMDRRAALRRACAAGAIAVTRPGAADSIPLLWEVESILRR